MKISALDAHPAPTPLFTKAQHVYLESLIRRMVEDAQPAPAAQAPCEHGWDYLKSIPASRVCRRCGLAMTQAHPSSDWEWADPCKPVSVEAAAPPATTVEQEASLEREAKHLAMAWHDDTPGGYASEAKWSSNADRNRWLRVAARARSLRSPAAATGGVTEAMRNAVKRWREWLDDHSSTMYCTIQYHLTGMVEAEIASLDSGASVVVDRAEWEQAQRRLNDPVLLSDWQKLESDRDSLRADVSRLTRELAEAKASPAPVAVTDLDAAARTYHPQNEDSAEEWERRVARTVAHFRKHTRSVSVEEVAREIDSNVDWTMDDNRRAARAALRVLGAREKEPARGFVDVVFDGPPSHESGRFVECEDPQGRSFNAGEWIDRKDGFWALRIPLAASPARGFVVDREAMRAAFLNAHANWRPSDHDPEQRPEDSPLGRGANAAIAEYERQRAEWEAGK